MNHTHWPDFTAEFSPERQIVAAAEAADDEMRNLRNALERAQGAINELNAIVAAQSTTGSPITTLRPVIHWTEWPV